MYTLTHISIKLKTVELDGVRRLMASASQQSERGDKLVLYLLT
jgi:hypothetical protein